MHIIQLYLITIYKRKPIKKKNSLYINSYAYIHTIVHVYVANFIFNFFEPHHHICMYMQTDFFKLTKSSESHATKVRGHKESSIYARV